MFNYNNSCMCFCAVALLKPQLKITSFTNYKHWYLIHKWSDALSDSAVPFLHGGSLEITLTVPYIIKIKIIQKINIFDINNNYRIAHMGLLLHCLSICYRSFSKNNNNKKLSFCNKVKFSNSYILTTLGCKPMLFQM